MKGALRTAAGLAILALLVWVGIYISWHIRIIGALRTMETQTVPATSTTAPPTEAEAVLIDAGCRALPYLVGALDPTKNPYFLNRVTYFITESGPAANQVWIVRPEDAVADRSKKCDMLREWWRDHGSEYHQTWRIWSRACAAK